MHPSGGGDPIAAEVEYDEEAQRAAFLLAEPAQPGQWRLTCRFTGVLNDQLRGFYRSVFTDADGREQAIATTQFEATDARRAFPCWDEPDFKASFGVTLVAPEGLTAVSNEAEVGRRSLGDGRVEITFADTIPMSTYLAAFAVGPFAATEPVDVDGVPLRVIAPQGKEGLAEYALRCGEFCLRYLTDYYGIPYPGGKLDLVAIPDFAFGAMENLGCVTFRETALPGGRRLRYHRRADAGAGRDRPRVGPHVVRGFGDHGMVGRDLAQRGFRHVHGDESHRRHASRLEPVAGVRRRRNGPGR